MWNRISSTFYFIVASTTILTSSELKSQVSVLSNPSSVNSALERAMNTGEYTLEACIAQALNQNIDVQLSMLSQTQSELTLEQSIRNFGPDVSGSAGQFYQSGRSIDRFTNQFVQSTIGSNNFQLQGSLLLFGGLQNQNNYKQAKENWLASGMDLKAMQLTVTLQVASAYIQYLQANESLIAAAQMLESSRLQLERGQKIFDAGGSTQGALLSLKAQVANDAASVTNAENVKTTALQNLKQLIRVEYHKPFRPLNEDFGVIAQPFAYTASQLVDSILLKRPDYQAAAYRVAAAEFGLKSAKGATMPTLSVGGNLNTVYSDNAKTVDNVSVIGFSPIGRVQGTNELVEAPDFAYSMSTKRFGDQIHDNFGKSLGVNLSIPVYSGLSRQNQVKTANLAVLRAKLNLERIQQNVQNEVLSAFNNYQNAEKRYASNLENKNLQAQNQQYVKQRYEAGAASYFEYQLAISTSSAAHQNYISAKYELAFRRLVLEFYLSANQNQTSINSTQK
jgi:outer membrane protein